ncbi:hypothetical protein [Rhizobium phage RHph_X3_15]|nr:hypothetical protein [Rhizobium phage RHph_X3_15]
MNVRNWKAVEVGRTNLDRVRQFFQTHLCATQRECAEELNLSLMAVNRHVKTIRAEWKNHDLRRDSISPH